MAHKTENLVDNTQQEFSIETFVSKTIKEFEKYPVQKIHQYLNSWDRNGILNMSQECSLRFIDSLLTVSNVSKDIGLVNRLLDYRLVIPKNDAAVKTETPLELASVEEN